MLSIDPAIYARLIVRKITIIAHIKEYNLSPVTKLHFGSLFALAE
jgi:hypothetical protein